MRYKRKTQNVDKFSFLKNKKVFLWVFAGVFMSFQVLLSLQVANLGLQLSKLETEREELMRINQTLSEELVLGSSLAGAKEKAEDMGFYKPERVVFINEEEAVAEVIR